MKKELNRCFILLLMSFLCQLAGAQNSNRVIDSLLVVLQSAKPDTNKVITLIHLGIQYRTVYGPQFARPYIDTAMILSDQLGYQRGKANAENSLGFYYMDINAYDSAIVHYILAFNLFETIGSKISSAQCSNNLGIIYQKKKNYPAALKWYTICYQICDTLNSNYGKNLALNNIALVYMAQNNYKEAVQISSKRLKLNLELKDLSEAASTYTSMGGSYYQLGNYTDALQNYLSALEFYEQLGDKQGTALAHHNIALLYQVQGKYEEALTSRLTALKLYIETDDKQHLAQCLADIGDIYMHQDNFEKGSDYQHQSLQLSIEANDTFMIAQCYSNIGIIFAKQNNDSAAIRMYFKSLALFENTGDKLKLAWVNKNIGSSICRHVVVEKFSDSNLKFQEGISHINKGLALAKEVEAQGLVKEAYEALSEAFSRVQNYQKALEYQNLFIALKDSLLNNETTRNLEQLRTQYEVDKAISAEKVTQDSLLAEQKFAVEKAQAEINARHALAIAEAKAKEERAVEAARYRYLLQLAAAKNEQEKQLAEQQYQNDLSIAEETAYHQIAMADEKAKQEQKEAEMAERQKREKVERERRTEMALSGTGFLALLSVFFFLYQRQRNLKRKAEERAETIHKMTELELQSLRAQLNPHFMFNSLNAIQELILLEENDKSHTYLARFAKLLRMLLENANNPFIPLARELEFLQLYLSLEKLRIPDLTYTFDIDQAILTEQIKIPNMILQPYIENAIWHGLSHKQHGDRKILIRVQQDSIGIKYEIEDNGVGREKAAELKSAYRKAHKSKGMELLTKRFKLLNTEYGSEINTAIEDIIINQTVGGTKVCIHVPIALQKHPSLV